MIKCTFIGDSPLLYKGIETAISKELNQLITLDQEFIFYLSYTTLYELICFTEIIHLKERNPDKKIEVYMVESEGEQIAKFQTLDIINRFLTFSSDFDKGQQDRWKLKHSDYCISYIYKYASVSDFETIRFIKTKESENKLKVIDITNKSIHDIIEESVKHLSTKEWFILKSLQNGEQKKKLARAYQVESWEIVEIQKVAQEKLREIIKSAITKN